MTQLAESSRAGTRRSGDLQVAVVGCGYWGPNLIRNFSQAPGASVALACDLSAEVLAATAERNPGLPLTDDFALVLSDPAIDAVVIATPAATHFDLARRALEAGKHVWAEKPLTLDPAEARSLAELAARKRLTLMVDHIYLFTPAVRYMRAAVDGGDLGDVLYFDSQRIKRGGALPEDVSVVWDLGIHDVYLLDHLVPQRPVAVSATGAIHATASHSIAFVTVHYPDETIAHFCSSWLSPSKVRLTTICGTEGAIVFDDNAPRDKLTVFEGGDIGDGGRTLVEYDPEDGTTPELVAAEPLQEAARHFIDCVTSGATPISDGGAGARAVALAAAAERSLLSGGSLQEVQSD